MSGAGRALAGLVCTAAAMAWSGPAAATEFCDVLAQRDGFVALRAHPTPESRLVARMHVGDEVILRHQTSANGWSYVSWLKGGHQRMTKNGLVYQSDGPSGWVNPRLISECG